MSLSSYRPYENEEERYVRMWSEAVEGSEDPDKLAGRAAFDFFMSSGLSKGELREIWELADSDKKFYLNMEQFFVAVRLISLYSRGRASNDLNEPYPVPLPEKWGQKYGYLGPLHKKGDRVRHIKTNREGRIVGVHIEDLINGVYYTILLDDGNELQTTEMKLCRPGDGISIANDQNDMNMDHQLEPEPIPDQPEPEPEVDWSLTPDLHQRYASIFQGVQLNGLVSWPKALEFFGMSGLDLQRIEILLKLADRNQDQQLNELEFCVGFHMAVGVAKKGKPMPQTLPMSLQQLYEVVTPPTGDFEQVPDIHQLQSQNNPSLIYGQSPPSVAPEQPLYHQSEYVPPINDVQPQQPGPIEIGFLAVTPVMEPTHHHENPEINMVIHPPSPAEMAFSQSVEEYPSMDPDMMTQQLPTDLESTTFYGMGNIMPPPEQISAVEETPIDLEAYQADRKRKLCALIEDGQWGLVRAYLVQHQFDYVQDLEHALQKLQQQHSIRLPRVENVLSADDIASLQARHSIQDQQKEIITALTGDADAETLVQLLEDSMPYQQQYIQDAQFVVDIQDPSGQYHINLDKWKYIYIVVSEETKKSVQFLKSISLSKNENAQAELQKSIKLKHHVYGIASMNHVCALIDDTIVKGVCQNVSIDGTTFGVLSQDRLHQFEIWYQVVETLGLPVEAFIDASSSNISSSSKGLCKLTLVPLESGPSCYFAGESYLCQAINLWMNLIESA